MCRRWGCGPHRLPSKVILEKKIEIVFQGLYNIWNAKKIDYLKLAMHLSIVFFIFCKFSWYRILRSQISRKVFPKPSYQSFFTNIFHKLCKHRHAICDDIDYFSTILLCRDSFQIKKEKKTYFMKRNLITYDVSEMWVFFSVNHIYIFPTTLHDVKYENLF